MKDKIKKIRFTFIERSFCKHIYKQHGLFNAKKVVNNMVSLNDKQKKVYIKYLYVLHNIKDYEESKILC